MTLLSNMWPDGAATYDLCDRLHIDDAFEARGAGWKPQLAVFWGKIFF